MPPQSARLPHVDHIDQCGVARYQEVCRLDLEGIVAKRRDAPYDPDAPTWVKIKNRQYPRRSGGGSGSIRCARGGQMPDAGQLLFKHETTDTYRPQCGGEGNNWATPRARVLYRKSTWATP